MGDSDLLQKLLVAQVLTLASTMRVEQKLKNASWGTSDLTSEAVRKIKDKQAEIIALLLSKT